MSYLELILSKNPSEWTDEEWDHVKASLPQRTNAVESDLVANPPIVADEFRWYNHTPIGQKCILAEFFKNNPKATSAMILCPCPGCSSSWC